MERIKYSPRLASCFGELLDRILADDPPSPARAVTVNRVQAAKAARALKLDLAEVYLAKAQCEIEATLPFNWRDALRANFELAVNLWLQGKNRQSLPHIERCLELLQRHFAKRNLAVADLLEMSAYCLTIDKRYPEAEKAMRQCLLLRELLLKANHESTISSWDSLCAILLQQGDLSSALIAGETALTGWLAVNNKARQSLALARLISICHSLALKEKALAYEASLNKILADGDEDKYWRRYYSQEEEGNKPCPAA